MAARATSRTYGSLGRPLSTENVRAAPYSGFSGFDLERKNRSPPRGRDAITEIKLPNSHHNTRRWAVIAGGCGLAFVAVAALMHAGKHVPDIGTSNPSVSNTVIDASTAQYRQQSEDAAISLGERYADGDSREVPRAKIPAPHFDGSTPSADKSKGVHANLRPLAFTALNFYHIRDGKPAADYPWLMNVKLVEPFRETTLSVSNARDGFEYRWSVRAGANDDSAGEVELTAIGKEVVVKMTKLDENVVTLEEVDEDTGVIARRLDETVMVKYVRREIRTLTDEERVELLNSMQKLWTDRVQGGYGKEKYGDDYSDIWAINRLHYKAASPQSCDHFHDGLGFLTNHALLSNTFEYSLQRVNPKLTLPYWDFTIESSSAGGAGDGVSEPQASSPLLQSAWFGTHDSTDNQVKDGRWAFTEIPLEHVNNPGGVEGDVYRKLRAPWNVNDRAYLTRGLGQMCGVRVQEAYPWPTCQSHYKLATEYTDFYSWVWYSLYDPHGPVHIWLGGTLDCADTYENIKELVGTEVAKELAYVSFVHRKNLFRDGLFKCEGNVGVSEKPDEVMQKGVCGCLGYDLDKGDDYKTVMNTMWFLGEKIGGFDDDTQRQVVRLLCSGIMNDGDHLQASSSLDPTFWPTHPTMERLWMYTILAGKITDFTWPDADVTLTASDGSTYSERISLYGDDCVGHGGSDVFPFGLLKNDTAEFKVRTGIKDNVVAGNALTNREVLHAFDPRDNNLPYVYDTFKWTHCAEDGHDLEDARGKSESTLESSKPQAPTRTTHGDTDVGADSGKVASDGGHGRVGARAMFKKGALRYPRYNSLQRMASHGPQLAD